MTITCVLCSKKFTSLLIPPEKALQDLQPRIDVHIKERHLEEVKKVQVTVQRIIFLCAWYLTATQILNVPEDESYLQGLIQKHQDEIMRLLGFDKTAELVDEITDQMQETKNMLDNIDVTKKT